MMPKQFKAERLSLCVKFAIVISNLCNKWVKKRVSGHCSMLIKGHIFFTLNLSIVQTIARRNSFQ